MRLAGLFACLLLGACASTGAGKPDPAPPSALAEGDKLFAGRKYNDARAKYEDAANSALAEGDASSVVEAQAQVARTYGIQGKFDEGRPWLSKAATMAHEDMPLGWSRYLGVRGRFEWQDQKDNARAKATFIQMYDYCVKHKLRSRALDAAHMVAIVGTKADQEEWALKAIAEADASGETGWLASLWNNLGWHYDEENRTDKALIALQNARTWHYKTGNEFTQMVADFYVAHALRRTGKLKEAREMLISAFARAKTRYAADETDKESGEWVGWGHKYLGDLMVDEGNKAEALLEYKAARHFLVAADIEKWGPEFLKALDDKIAALSG